MNQQRERNIESQHRNTVIEITTALLRVLAPYDIMDWVWLSYGETLEYAMKALEQEFADVNEDSSANK